MKIFLIGIIGFFSLISVLAVKKDGELVIETEEGEVEIKNGKHNNKHNSQKHRRHRHRHSKRKQNHEMGSSSSSAEDYYEEDHHNRKQPKNQNYKEEPVYYNNVHGLSIHNTCKYSGMVALTFDDGVVPETSQILDILSKNGVPGTFFVLGSTIDHYPMYRTILNRILNEGHTLGSHTYSHADLTSLGSDGIKYELNQAGNIFENACGERPKFMRPPYG